MSEDRGYPQLAEATLRAFREIHDRVFRGDPAENPRLTVLVVGGRVVADTPALVLLTPWTCNGLAFPPDGRFPDRVEVAGRPLAARPVDVPRLGRLFSANLMGDVSRIASQEAGTALATGWVEPWLAAVATARGAGPAAPADAPPRTAPPGTAPPTPAPAPDPVPAAGPTPERPAPGRGITRRGLFTLGRE